LLFAKLQDRHWKSWIEGASRVIDPRMTTTAFTLDGYRTTRSLGVVRGISVRTRSIFGTFVASLQMLVGGRNVLFSELAERTRREAFELMLNHADRTGANAVVGVRYDATGSGAITEVLCYGTAVIVEPATGV
jgi:uncharacterized protein YbjQ (UPF0145 family)